MGSGQFRESREQSRSPQPRLHLPPGRGGPGSRAGDAGRKWVALVMDGLRGLVGMWGIGWRVARARLQEPGGQGPRRILHCPAGSPQSPAIRPCSLSPASGGFQQCRPPAHPPPAPPAPGLPQPRLTQTWVCHTCGCASRLPPEVPVTRVPSAQCGATARFWTLNVIICKVLLSIRVTNHRPEGLAQGHVWGHYCLPHGDEDVGPSGT